MALGKGKVKLKKILGKKEVSVKELRHMKAQQLLKLTKSSNPKVAEAGKRELERRTRKAS